MLMQGILECFASEHIREKEDFMQEGMQHVINVEYTEAYTCFYKAYLEYNNKGNEEMEMQALRNMAVCAFWNGETDSCIIHLGKSVEIARKIKDSFAEYELYSNMNSAYYVKEDMGHALEMSQKMDSIAANSKDVRIRFDKLHRLSQEASEQYNIKLQEQYLLEREKLLDELPNNERTSAKFNVYSELSTFYIGIHNVDKARKYIRLNINTSMEKTNKSIMDYMTYGNEAIYCAYSQNRKAAFEALDSIRYGLEYCKDASDVHWMSYYGNMGDVFSVFQEWDHAIEAYEKALDAVKGKELYFWVIYNNYLLNLSNAYHKTGQIEKVRNCYQQNVEFSKKMWGDFQGAALWLLSRFECMLGEFDTGCDNYMQSSDIIKKTIANQLRYKSNQERESFWQMYATNLWEMGAYALVAGELQSKFTQKSYDALLFSKAFLLETDRSIAMAINKECSKEEQRMYYEMVNLQRTIKNLAKDYGTNKERIDQLHRRISFLDEKLTSIISRLGFTSFLDIDYTAIKNILDGDEAILDFSDYDGDVHQYAVYVINKEQTYPRIIKSFTTEDLNSLLDNKPLDVIYKSPIAEKAVNLIWKPVSEEVKGKDTIYYVPSGIIHEIALESLPLKDGTLLGQHYHFVRLTSAREIAKIKHNTHHATAMRNVTLYGALQYDMDTTLMAVEAKHYDIKPYVKMTRGVPKRGNGKWNELKNTKEEIDSIGEILKQHHVSLTPLTGTKGTEESFFSMSGNAPQILHIATHGFYYTPEEAKKVDFLNGYQDAMQLSGLILSGGNLEWTGQPIPKGVMGGVLTANDIATLDLRGTDLVVLSACQTGLGKVTPEGLYGLQRAFKKAGVQTIVMTLWNVSDVATKEFMVKFYEELTDGDDKWNKRKAFENAKKHIRNNPDYKDPYYWAGFVMLD